MFWEPSSRQRRTHGQRRLWGGLLLAVALVSLAGCAGLAAVGPMLQSNVVQSQASLIAQQLQPPMKNHLDAAGPLYTGQHALDDQPADDLVVVSYNLRYGEELAAFVEAFRAVQPLPAADIILLQEMDEAGVAEVAEALGYNYVYYPASVAEDGDNFGNAILARWPISDPAKLILPGLHPLTGQQRTATRAKVNVNGADILVYSTHIEIATAPPALRAEQIAAIAADIPADAERVIVGGDFNTVTSLGVEALAGQFASIDMNHDTAALGPTFTRFGLRPSATDHIFSRGLEWVNAGVLDGITASDHYPVWVEFTRS
jgi:endonuclease/exonuclease/phosphatase family metal-dependent hydrolase